MNPHLARLHQYPFEKLAKLKAGITPPTGKPPIALSIGEPKHAAPEFVGPLIQSHLQDLSQYPPTKGQPALREAIADWACARYRLKRGTLDPERHILPANGTREALFAFAQCVIDAGEKPLVLMPNPFYQIYEGAALLAGAEPYYLNTTQANGFLPDFDAVPDAVWRRCRLLYLCSPGNPTGVVTSLATLQALLEKTDRYGFAIAADECYSEIYFDEAQPPVGLLQACAQLGRDDFKRCMVFNSLSKRSNLPGLRSGFIAGDADLMRAFLLYRTYHGSAMPLLVQAVSATAWRDEEHVRANRVLYRDKFAAVLERLRPALDVEQPQGGFFLWPRTPIDDTEFTRRLYAEQNVTVLPGSYLSREQDGLDPGRNRVRMALVAPVEECLEAARRIREFMRNF